MAATLDYKLIADLQIPYTIQKQSARTKRSTVAGSHAFFQSHVLAARTVNLMFGYSDRINLIVVSKASLAGK